MRLKIISTFIIGAMGMALSAPVLADNSTPPPQAADVTMTVIPAGQDPVKTVVQTISVPPAKGKPGKDAKGKEFGQQTAAAVRQREESHESAQAEQHEATPAGGQQGEEASEQAQQQAEEAAERQAAQAQQQSQQVAQQAQQQAQAERQKHQPPPPPPHPPGI